MVRSFGLIFGYGSKLKDGKLRQIKPRMTSHNHKFEKRWDW